MRCMGIFPSLTAAQSTNPGIPKGLSHIAGGFNHRRHCAHAMSPERTTLIRFIQRRVRSDSSTSWGGDMTNDIFGRECEQRRPFRTWKMVGAVRWLKPPAIRLIPSGEMNIDKFFCDFGILHGEKTWTGLEPAPTSLHYRK